jgi:hypothetical protein
MNGERIKAASMKDGGEDSEIVPMMDQRMSATRALADKQVPNAKPAMRRIVLPPPTVEKAKDARARTMRFSRRWLPAMCRPMRR